MSGLYVPLDVEFDSDDKLILAGPMAELLYIRSLAFAKRTMSNGDITNAQLVVIGRGIPNAKKHAKKLEDVGAWRTTTTGWHIAAWLKRNKSVDAIATEREVKKAASVKANHERWHVGDTGKPSALCPLCYPTSYPKPDAKADPKPKPEPEGEPKPEGEGEGEGEGKSSSISGNSNSARQTVAAAALKLLFDHRMTTAQTPGLANLLRRELPNEWREPIATFIQSHPDTTPEEIAAIVLKVPGLTYATSEPKPAWYHDPQCECGDGWTTNNDGYVEPCHCRRPDPYIATVTPIRGATA